MNNPMTIATARNGNLVRIACGNGYTVSIGIGPSHYCDHHSLASIDDTIDAPTATMEIAIFNADGHIDYRYTGDDVGCRVPVERLGKIILAVGRRDADACRELCCR